MFGRDDAEVLVVGGDPVALSRAMDLAQRGGGVMLAETPAASEPPSVRCNHVSARTMEIFRRLDPVSAVRNAGLPADYPNDVAFRTTATGIEAGGLVAAAAHRGVPMAVLDVDADEAAALYPRKVLLSRPDLHVAWRGDKPPEDPLARDARAKPLGAASVHARQHGR